MQDIIKLKASNITLAVQATSIINKASRLDASLGFNGNCLSTILNGWEENGQLDDIFETIAREGEGSTISAAFLAMGKLINRIEQFANACKIEVDIGGGKTQNAFQFIASNKESIVISRIFNPLSKLEDLSFLNEFTQCCSLARPDGRNALEFVAQDGNAITIALILNALSKLEDHIVLSEFIDYCLKVRADGRNIFEIAAQKGDVISISNLCNALWKMGDEEKMNKFIEACCIPRKDGRNAIKIAIEEGSPKAITNLFSCLLKLKDTSRFNEFMNYYLKTRRDGGTVFEFISQEGGWQDLVILFASLLKFSDKKALNEFINCCFKTRRDGRNCFDVMSESREYVAISMILNATSKMNNLAAFMEFCNHCLTVRSDGRNAFEFMAQESDTKSISLALNALKKNSDKLHILIKICENVVRPDCGTNAFEYIASHGEYSAIALSLNAIYGNCIKFNSEINPHLVKAGVKIITNKEHSNILDNSMTLEAITRIRALNPEVDTFNLDEVLLTEDTYNLMFDLWKHNSDELLEFDCPIEKIKARIQNASIQDLYKNKELVRLIIISRFLDIIHAKCSENEDVRATVDELYKKSSDALDLRTHINALISGKSELTHHTKQEKTNAQAPQKQAPTEMTSSDAMALPHYTAGEAYSTQQRTKAKVGATYAEKMSATSSAKPLGQTSNAESQKKYSPKPDLACRFGNASGKGASATSKYKAKKPIPQRSVDKKYNGPQNKSGSFPRF